MTSTVEVEFLPPGEIVRVPPIAVSTERRDLSAEEARALTDEIVRSTKRLYILVFEADRLKAWKALGYPDFKSYVVAELPIQEAQAYNLVMVGKVMHAALGAIGAGHEALDSLDPVTIRNARRVKDNLRGFQRAITANVKRGMDIGDAIRDASTHVVSRSDMRGERSETYEYIPCTGCAGSGKIFVDKRRPDDAEELADAIERTVRRHMNK